MRVMTVVTRDTIIGGVLKSIRQGLSLTQKEFAEEIEVSEPTVCRREKGDISASASELISICNHFELNAAEAVSEVCQVEKLLLNNGVLVFDKAPVDEPYAVLNSGGLSTLIVTLLAGEE